MSEAKSPLTKSAETNVDQDAAAPEPEESEKQAVEQDEGDENEEEQSRAQTAPDTPSSVNPPSQQSQMTPQPMNVPIQPFYPYPYPHYPGMPMHYMPHPSSSNVYTDASTMMDPPPDARRNRGGVTEPFPEKLHRMLQICEQEGRSDIVSFFPHGRAFAIHKPRKFQSEIMPRFFRQSRLTSFQRQLNLYGFKRISQGPDHGGYYHELFLKGRPGLCINLKRTKIKGPNKQSKQEFEGEPNFYAMPPIRPAVPTAMPTPQAGAVATNGTENTAIAPQASPLTNIPSPAGVPMQHFQYSPYGYPPPGSYMFPVPPNAQPYTATQSPGPGDGLQQQQQQVSQTIYPYPFFSYPPVWGTMPSSQASSPTRPSAPPTPADNSSPCKTETQEG